MPTRPRVLLIDDGELDDVRVLLTELGVAFEHLRGGQVPGAVAAPEQVFIATSRRAAVARDWAFGSRGEEGPTRICVVTEDSNTLRNMLRRMGFELLIRRPVHPYALRLVILRALYHGDERRREQRVPIGTEVGVRSGLRRRTAMLADLSTRGCRLLSKRPFAVGSRVTVQLPRELTEGRTLSLRARVIRTRDAGDEAQDGHSVALGFEKISMDARRQIFQIMKDRAHGPARLPRAAAPEARPSAPPAASCAKTAEEAAPPRLPLAAPGSGDDRRKHPRVPFEREVMALGEAAGRAVIGRDLSAGGMRVEPHPDLGVGDALRLAIYGRPREDPFIVRAQVVRDDGPDGLGLRFEDLPEGTASRLEALVAVMPSVESLEGEESEALGSVVSEILERVPGQSD